MTINELDTLAATHGLWNFEISTGRRFSDEIILRRNICDIITLVIKVDRYSCEITSRGMCIQTDSSVEPTWFELTDDQIKQLGFYIN